jgi:NitT/TauT family transport system substrate-binding protein
MNKLMPPVLAAALILTPSIGAAQEVVRASGFTWPSYGYWSIVEQEKLSDSIAIEFQLIEDPYDSMGLLAAGQLDVVLSTLEYAPLAASEGLPINVVAYYAISHGADKIIVGPDIAQPSDLVGKTVGVLEGGLPEIFMAMWMESNGLDMSKSVTTTNVIADDVFAAMVGGSISAGVFWEPFASNVLEVREGARLVANSADPEWLRSGVIADAIYMNSDFVAAKPEVAAEFVRSYFEAIAWRAENPDEGNAIIAEAMRMPVEDVGAVLGTAEAEGDLYVYSFAESARLCGAIEGDPPFGQTNGQITQIWGTISTWWVRLGRLPEMPASTVNCSLVETLAAAGFGAN